AAGKADTAQAIAQLPPRQKSDLARLVLAAFAVLSQNQFRPSAADGRFRPYCDACESSLTALHNLLLHPDVRLAPDDLPDVARSASQTKFVELWNWVGGELADVLARSVAIDDLDDTRRKALIKIRERIARDPAVGSRDAVSTLDDALGLTA